jgi:hypothetical protein
LHGRAIEAQSIDQAITIISSYDKSSRKRPFVRFEIEVRYSNGNDIRGKFHDKMTAISFLRRLLPASRNSP